MAPFPAKQTNRRRSPLPPVQAEPKARRHAGPMAPFAVCLPPATGRAVDRIGPLIQTDLGATVSAGPAVEPDISDDGANACHTVASFASTDPPPAPMVANDPSLVFHEALDNATGVWSWHNVRPRAHVLFRRQVFRQPQRARWRLSSRARTGSDVLDLDGQRRLHP